MSWQGKNKQKTENSFKIYQTGVKELSSGQYKHLYVLAGEERFLVVAFLQKLLDSLNLSRDLQTEVDAHIVEVEAKISNLDWSALISECQMPAFMAKKRLLLIKQSSLFQQALTGEKLDCFQKLLTALANSQSSICVFIEEKVDLRLKHCQALSKSATCAIYNFSHLPEDILAAWLAKELNKKGLKITNSALASLIERSNSELLILQTELHKLALYCQAKQKNAIDLAMLDKLLQHDLQASIFELLDAVGTKDLLTAKKIMSILQENKQAFLLTLLLLGRHMRELLLAKIEPAALSVNAWKLRKLQAQANKFTAAELKDLIIFCADCDVAYKTSNMAEEALSDLLLVKLIRSDLEVKFAELAI